MCFCDPYGAEQHLKEGSQTQVLSCSSPLSGAESQGALSVGKEVNCNQLEVSEEGKK